MDSSERLMCVRVELKVEEEAKNGKMVETERRATVGV